MKKIHKLTKIIVCAVTMFATFAAFTAPLGLYASGQTIDASNYSENRERLEQEVNVDANGRSTLRNATTTKDYTYGTYGRIHIDGWDVEILSTNVDSAGYHTITFKADEYYDLPEVSKSGEDVRFAHVQYYRTDGKNSYTVNEDKTIGTLRFKPSANRDAYDETPTLIRLVGVSQQNQGAQSSYLSNYVFKEVSHSAIEFTGEEAAAGISFQLNGSRTYLVKAKADLKVYPTDNPWFKPIETSDVKTGVNSSSDFSNRYSIIKGTSGDSSGDRIAYDATAFSVKVYNAHTKTWEIRSVHDFYHTDQTIKMPEVTDSSIYYDGYRVNGFVVQRLVYEPKMANIENWAPKETVGLDYTIQTYAADYNRQWTSTGMDPTRDEFRESSLRHRAGNIFINATWIKIYNVTFVDYDGTNLSNQVIDKGNDATAPADPARDGYTFTGWDKPYVNIQGDLVITATYSENPKEEKVNVTFVDYDGTNLSNQVIDKGSDAIAPASPTRDGYSFAGWDKAFTNVQSDLVVVATYTPNTIVTPPTEIPPAETPNTPPTPVTPVVNVTTPEVTPESTPEVTPDVNPGQDTPEEVEKDKVIVEKNDTPKAKGNTGSWALLNLIATILTIIIAIILMFVKHQKEDEKDDMNYVDGKATVQYTRRRWTKVVSLALPILAIVVFVLTEDMSLPMIIVDKWTILMVVIFFVQVVIFFVGRKWKNNDEDKNKQQGAATLNQGTI